MLPYQRSLSALPLIRGLSEEARPGKRLSHRDIELSLRIITLIENHSSMNQYIQLDEIDISHGDYIELTLKRGSRS